MTYCLLKYLKVISIIMTSSISCSYGLFSWNWVSDIKQEKYLENIATLVKAISKSLCNFYICNVIFITKSLQSQKFGNSTMQSKVTN